MQFQEGARKFSRHGVLRQYQTSTVAGVLLWPGPSGWEIAHRVRELVPTLPVVYTSGDCASEWAANGVPNSLMLQKPSAMAQLVTGISQLKNTGGVAS
jgi:two-component system cell cycle response regulator CpdR